jgi:hypothetical protein
MKRFLLLSIAAALATAGQLGAATPPAIDPNALSLLKRMSDTLAQAKSFSYRSRVIMEVPSVTGQFLTLFPEGDVVVKRPSSLRARYAGDAPPFDLFYDGASVSVFAPHASVYSTTNAPATLDAMLTGLRRETGVRLPAIPLLKDHPYEALTRDLQSAVVVGETKVNGVACDHLAFRRPGVNWEIWIETGRYALPRRLAATFTDRPNFPRSIIDFSSWNLHPWVCSSLFHFRAPKGAKEIPFAAVLKDIKDVKR